MDNIFANLFRYRQREATPTPGVPSSTMPQETEKPSGAEYAERIIAVRSPEDACSVSAVYRAMTLRADTMGVMPVQYQKKDFEGGNFTQDMRGLGKRINYLLQEEPNPIMTATDLWKLVEINRVMFGNGFVYIERDEYGFPDQLWLVKYCGYNINDATFVNLVYLSDHGYVTKVNVPNTDVLFFPNTFRYPNGLGIPTLRYAFETLTLNRTLRSQSLETAAKGGRIKGIISEKQPTQGQGTLAFGLLNPEQVNNTAQEMQRKFYSGEDIVSMHGLESFQNLSLSAQDMQMIELLGMSHDDVARFYATPRPLLMMDTNSHYTTYTNATMEYLSRTIAPDGAEMEAECFRKFLSIYDYGQYRFHLCEQPLLRMDKETQAKVDMLNLQTGAKTINEVRAEHDMPAVENGDEPMASANLMTLKALLAKADASTQLKPGTYTVGEGEKGGSEEG